MLLCQILSLKPVFGGFYLFRNFFCLRYIILFHFKEGTGRIKGYTLYKQTQSAYGKI